MTPEQKNKAAMAESIKQTDKDKSLLLWIDLAEEGVVEAMDIVVNTTPSDNSAVQQRYWACLEKIGTRCPRANYLLGKKYSHPGIDRGNEEDWKAGMYYSRAMYGYSWSPDEIRQLFRDYEDGKFLLDNPLDLMQVLELGHKMHVIRDDDYEGWKKALEVRLSITNSMSCKSCRNDRLGTMWNPVVKVTQRKGLFGLSKTYICTCTKCGKTWKYTPDPQKGY